MSKAEEFERGMQAVRMVYGSIWDRELGFAAEWADSVQLEGDIGDAEDGSICFRKDGSEFWFLIGDGQWDADDPRGEMIEVLLAERAKDGEALAVAKTALDAAEARVREVIAERDAWKQSQADICGAYAREKDRLHRMRDDAVSEMTIARLERDAAIREADRLRHGVPIEGDFVCPDSLALTAMTAARDEACRILDGCIADLVKHEDDPSMMDGHRALVAALRAVGGR